jgi:hypothetical protein
MARVVFTSQLARFVPCPPQEVQSGTLRSALDEAFGRNPPLRSYILDEQGAVRHHVVIFVDGEMLSDRVHLSDPVSASSEVYVMQSLSGG